ncbi:beta-ribofuranosylaminobenzene 5'-phosphate synthase family protein [Haladaptatus sp. T7]|uniref:beta-ribofuranosylaminobenzene 5'-phosphate synthase family protein n=1 Tax=Haladaptatus sp. T7 TaxID=2029368 RepID=UPI0021A25108|nr:beta-ribofuranosylaminobenzene 5'-phosphate synthase family protein [Haladaptatus sp. T7]GKZ12818.1 beta-ribofuranosylaminobenzene 5'-phosphate synthase [Haladaptatus sp. T7]
MAQVTVGGRLHFGFQNLSLAHERLYGGLGVALSSPTVSVEATPADEVRCDDPCAREYASRATDLLSVPGADVRVHRTLPRHVGLGSGTQLALAVFAAVAHAYGDDPAVREHAPALDRAGRSGIGVSTFERGGFVVDAGHPTERFTTARPARGDWSVPPVVARHDVPDDWRFVLVLPDAEPGRSGDDEDASMRSVVERADPTIAEDVSSILLRRLLPAIADGDPDRFGSAVAEIGRRNGAWYADEQGGVYRPPVGELVTAMESSPSVFGAGQSSWGPAVYGVTTRTLADGAVEAARNALDSAGVAGDVLLTSPRNAGASVNGKRQE